MKLTVTHQVRLTQEEQNLTDAICEGLTFAEIADEWKVEKKKVMAIKTKLYRKLIISTPLELYKLVHANCPHCGESIEYVPLSMRVEKP